MRAGSVVAALLMVVVVAAGMVLSGAASVQAVLEVTEDTDTALTLETAGGVVRVQKDVWSLSVSRKTAGGEEEVVLDDLGLEEYRLGFGRWVGVDFSDLIYPGYTWRLGEEVQWWAATSVVRWERVDTQSVRIYVDTEDENGAVMEVVVTSGGVADDGEQEDPTRVAIATRATGGSTDKANRVGAGFGSLPASEEGYYGFGERFNAANQRGHALYCQVEDGGWGFGFDEARFPKSPITTYVPMPFFLSPLGYGFWVDTSYRTDWLLDNDELHEAVCGDDPDGTCGGGFHVQAETTEMTMEVFLGPAVMDVVSKFSAITGRSLIPPKFQFGPWNQFSSEIRHGGPPRPWKREDDGEDDGAGNDSSISSMFRDMDPYELTEEEEHEHYLDLLQRPPLAAETEENGGALQGQFPNNNYVWALQWFIAHDIPVSVGIHPVHYFPKGSETDQQQQDIRAVQYSQARGVYQVVYYNSMVDTTYYPMYNVSLAKDLFVRLDDGSVYTFPYKGASDKFYCALFDFTNPDAVAFYQKQVARSVVKGERGFMLDYGEYLSHSALLWNGETGLAEHNLYPVRYQQAVFDYFRSVDDDPEDDYAPEYVYYTRSGYVGSGGVTWNAWTGDPYCDWSDGSGLRSQITAQLTVGMGGIPFSGTDISGFTWVLPPTLELWVRWTQVGLFSSTMHVQGGGTSILGISKTQIHDWPRGTYIWRKSAKLRMSLFPHIYTLAHEYRRTGIPIMRHHLLDFADDATARVQPYQYCFGKQLLIAPVVTEGDTTRDVYLPSTDSDPAVWYDVSSYLTFDFADGRHRIGYSPPLEGGQWVTVDAPLEVVPIFVRAGSVIPTQDPNVDSLNEAEQDGVVPASAKAHLVHLWVWPDADFASHGYAYDGLRVETWNATAEQGVVAMGVSLRDLDLRRSMLLQFALEPSLLDPDVIRVKHETFSASMRHVKDWRQLTWSNPAHTGKELLFPEEGWSVDANQSSLWVRVLGTVGVSELSVKFTARDDD